MVAIAHQIKLEGLLLKDLTEKFFSGEEERKKSVDEYIRVGTLILETVNALESSIPRGYLKRPLKKQVELLESDSTGFSLLSWWNREQSLEEFPNLSPIKREAAEEGRENGMRRYMEIYLDLIIHGVSRDI